MEASEVRKKFAEVTHRIEYGNERVVVERHGKPVVAMVSVEDLAALERMEDELDAKIARERLAEIKDLRADTVSLDDVIAGLA